MNSKGSEWNRWDLHFHTPSSYDYKDKTVSNVDIVNEMKRNSIAAFAVTDHHVIDINRYKELKELGKRKESQFYLASSFFRMQEVKTLYTLSVYFLRIQI